MKRLFSKIDKAILYLRAGGHCQICGEKLPTEWHADHKKPFCLGGPTKRRNAQALCIKCNLKKGKKDMSEQNDTELTEEKRPRKWQEEAFTKYITKRDQNQKNFLFVGTPGSGKTYMALNMLKYEKDRRNPFIVVFSPNSGCKTQWAESAALFDLNITENYELNTDDIHGWSVCYQLLSSQERVNDFLELTKERDTVVVFDEIHHLSDNNVWGINAKLAFNHAIATIGLSGTPFRSDSKTIPFVEYNEDGQCVPDYSYGYAKALSDGDVVRKIVFPYYEGVMSWVGRNGFIEASFEDNLSDADANDRLKCSIDPTEPFFQEMFNDADQRLNKIRATVHPNAGGLIFCIDQWHAGRVLDFVKKTNPDTVLAISDDSGSHEKIINFATSNTKWLISVRQVSEGVDIPRARVAVFANNIQTLTFFWQAIFRVGRYIKGIDNHEAWVFLPKHPIFISYVEEILKEISVYVDTLEELPIKPDDDEFLDYKDKNKTEFINLSARGTEEGQYYQGEKYPAGEIAEVQSFLSQNPDINHTPEVILARFLRHMLGKSPMNVPTVKNKSKSYDKRRQQKVDNITDLVAQIGGKVSRMTGKEIGKAITIVHQRCIDVLGKNQQQLNVDNGVSLDEKRNLLVKHRNNVSFWVR